MSKRVIIEYATRFVEVNGTKYLAIDYQQGVAEIWLGKEFLGSVDKVIVDEAKCSEKEAKELIEQLLNK